MVVLHHEHEQTTRLRLFVYCSPACFRCMLVVCVYPKWMETATGGFGEWYGPGSHFSSCWPGPLETLACMRIFIHRNKKEQKYTLQCSCWVAQSFHTPLMLQSAGARLLLVLQASTCCIIAMHIPVPFCRDCMCVG